MESGIEPMGGPLLRAVRIPFWVAAVALASVFADARTVRADAPRVFELSPKNGATDLDPSLRELRIVFDSDMDRTGYSLCGGGPTFPTVVGAPTWRDGRTLVVKVSLKPDTAYVIGVNCPSAQNFKSAKGEPLGPVTWRFSTSARRSRADQQQMNKDSFRALGEVMRENYSYYKDREVDWNALAKKTSRKIRDARSTATWIIHVAKMLSAAQDVHLWLEYNGQITPTFVRRVDANVDPKGLRKVLHDADYTQRNYVVATARTKKNIGYIEIRSWERQYEADLRVVQDAMREMLDTDGLVIDVRANAGGDERLAMAVAAWFIDGEKEYAQHEVRDGHAARGFAPVQSRRIRGNEKPEYYPNRVAVLTGPAVMSSCEAFLLMMKQDPKAMLIGETSYGSSGNPQPHELANGVIVYVPSWRALRPDGSCFEGKGIVPDIEVKGSGLDFQTGDPVLERALRELK